MSAEADDVELVCAPPLSPKRIQRRRTRGWRMPSGAVYVGRPSAWGNPFEVVPASGRRGGPLDMWGVIFAGQLLVRWDTRALAAAEAVDRFRQWIPPRWAENAQYELAGRDLACWCPLDQPCHADVLLELANPQQLNSAGAAPARPGPP